MEVDDIELTCLASHSVQHDQQAGGMITDPSQPEPLRNALNKFGRCLGIPACEQRHVVPLTHEFFGEPGNHPFRTAIELWGYGFGQWRHLSNSHRFIPA